MEIFTHQMMIPNETSPVSNPSMTLGVVFCLPAPIEGGRARSRPKSRTETADTKTPAKDPSIWKILCPSLSMFACPGSAFPSSFDKGALAPEFSRKAATSFGVMPSTSRSLKSLASNTPLKLPNVRKSARLRFGPKPGTSSRPLFIAVRLRRGPVERQDEPVHLVADFLQHEFGRASLFQLIGSD